ncbi:hypothetical protein Aduo_009330 [Ancylostoma duodenale]
MNDVDCFDPKTMQWSTVTPLLVAVSHAAVVSRSGKMFVIGGTCRGQVSSSVQVYHEATGTWELGAELGAGRSGAAAVAVALPAVGYSIPIKK